MSEAVRQLEPAGLWNNFADLNAVPRPSKKEERVIAFIKSFGEKLGLPTMVDEAGNVIIRKPASKGMENREIVILQSHLDMVHQKNADSTFNFNDQDIDMFVDGDWVKATGTTLGADNGIGVAAIMTILAASDIVHPPLEALFTIDEETGMTGALSLKAGLLTGKFLLNLDTEEDNELTIGCAGGIDVTASGTYEAEPVAGGKAFNIAVNGLTGGHSGVDIHKGRANANKLMNRLLFETANNFSIQIASIDGGSLRNAIPRESVATVNIPAANVDAFKKRIGKFEATVKEEYAFTDPALTVVVEEANEISSVLPADLAGRFIRSVYAAPNGIYRMTPEIPGLVQTSNNIAKVTVRDGKWMVQCLTRSSVDSEKTDLSQALAAAFELCGGTLSYGGTYPGWTPKPGAPIVQLMQHLYKELFKEEAHVNSVHAGLECGIIGTNYPEMQMISFGPNIYGAHSPDERAQISSVQKFWKFLLEALARIPMANAA
ncbi:MAG: aminoacyl-histidine dipeptidase [Pedobacter sp.]|nr:MAG: aminoacyl-histidine dipeptidase [Pedobacter sp.]